MGNSSSICNICFESKSSFITCDLNHVVCKQCLSAYVQSCCEDAGKLKDNGLVIACPEFMCTAKAWNEKSLKHKVYKATHEYFISTIEKHQFKVQSSNEGESLSIPSSLTNSIVNSLNITCPNCDNVLDQTPDGCCAIRCNHCATYFCWLCFEVSLNSASCHAHVSSCAHNSSRREPFVPQVNVEAAHKMYRLKKIREVLQTFWCSSKEETKDRSLWLSDKYVRHAVKEAEAVLKMNNIVVDDVLKE